MGSAPAIVTLTSDFGTTDGYVGAMKGVIRTLAPGARIVDLSHDIDPGDVEAGAWCLRVAAPEFPGGTIHLAVVDPGVGGSRFPVMISRGGQIFVGPDNGLLTLVPGKVVGAWVIDSKKVRTRDRISPTFHGRDLFAPAAARLASGAEPSRLGRRMDPAELVALPLDVSWREDEGCAWGRVVHVDRFGNVVTSLPASLLARACASGGSAGGRPVGGPVSSYTAIPSRGAAFIEGSQGLVEISVRDGSAARTLGVDVGDEVRITIVPGRER